MKKISIITGGSSGLGKELAIKLINRGQQVCILGRDAKKLDSVKKEICCLGFAGNIADESFVSKVFSQLKSDNYYVDFLYNCAGKGYFGEPISMHENNVRDIMESNVIGLLTISYEACREMINGGTIVNISSTAGLKGNANETLYCASKWAVRGFTEAMKAFYKKSSIHIVGVYPGGINTPFWSSECGMNPDVTKFMDPGEVAEVIVSNVLEKNTLYTADITIERK